jgi:hypothetical protein
MVADGWSQGIAGAARSRIAQPSARQQELIKIYKDPKYPEIRKKYEEDSRKKFWDKKLEVPKRDLSDFIRYYRENEKLSKKPILPDGPQHGDILTLEPKSKKDRSWFHDIMKKYRARPSLFMPPELTPVVSRIDAEVFAKSFFDYYYEEKLSNSLIINVRQEDRINLDVYCKGQPEGKTYVYDRIEDVLSLFHKDAGELLAQSNATMIYGIGDSLKGYTHREIFKSLGLPVIRSFARDSSEVHQIGPRSEALNEKSSQMTGENTVVVDGLPVDEEGLKNLSKDPQDLEDWRKADKSLRKLLLEEKSVVLGANAKAFRDILLRSDNKVVIYIIADTKNEGFRFPDGSSITAEAIDHWEARDADVANLPVVVFLGCNTANIGRGLPGEIIRALLRQGYMSSGWATRGFITPDRVKEVIETLLRDKDSWDDKLPELERVVDRTLQKTAEQG